MAIRDIENREKILFLEAVFEKPSVCLCFGDVLIDRVLLISVDLTGCVFYFGDWHETCLIYSNVSFDASALVFIPNSHSCNGSL